MRQYTLDNITKGYLLKKGLTIHDYIQALTYACDCLRELSFDSLQTIKTSKIPVNSYKAIAIPSDYVDYVSVNYIRNQRVVEMQEDNSLNRMNNYNDNGTKIPYDVGTSNDLVSGDYDIETSRFNHDTGHSSNSFKVLLERNEIQLDNRCDAEYIILDYIGDGLDTNAESSVHPYAIVTIEAYMAWKFSPNADNIQSPEGFNFFINHKTLRARKDGLTLNEIIKGRQKAYTQTIKN